MSLDQPPGQRGFVDVRRAQHSPVDRHETGPDQDEVVVDETHVRGAQHPPVERHEIEPIRTRWRLTRCMRSCSSLETYE